MVNRSSIGFIVSARHAPGWSLVVWAIIGRAAWQADLFLMCKTALPSKNAVGMSA
jgi:hypothetical protein